MNRLLLIMLFFLGISTCFSQNTELDKSILSVKPIIKNDFSKFNKDLNKEIKFNIIAIYNKNDLNMSSLNINTAYFLKPMSKIAYEDYNETLFFKKSLPKHVDFLNFQRNINNPSF